MHWRAKLGNPPLTASLHMDRDDLEHDGQLCKLSLPFTIYRLPFTIYRLPFTIYRLPFTIYRLPFTIYRLLFTVYYLLFTIYCLLFTLYCLLFTVYYLLVLLFMRLWFLSKANESVALPLLVLEHADYPSLATKPPHTTRRV
jgi:hypothetical protein